MEIEKILDELKVKYGDKWPEAAFGRWLVLHTSISGAGRHHPKTYEEERLLSNWILTILKKEA